MDLVTKEITAQNTFSDRISVKGNFSISIAGTFVATVTVQRSFDAGSSWADVDTFTAPIETIGFDPIGVNYRIGVKTGDFTSGTVTVTIRENDIGS